MQKDFFVIFDMDGVIFDSEKACFECWVEAADMLKVKGMREFYPRIIGTNAAQTLRMARETFDGITGEGTAEELQRLSSGIFHRKYDNGGLPLKKGAEEILGYLRDEGIRTALASSTRTRQVIRELTNAGHIDYFDSVTGGDSVTISKPDPRIISYCLRKAGEPPPRDLCDRGFLQRHTFGPQGGNEAPHGPGHGPAGRRDAKPLRRDLGGPHGGTGALQ
ncbi:MAG: HAD family phosphatase [Eubacteriales bacterium]|nr:HAD family phosphatase [Eubacteriales bacterium]